MYDVESYVFHKNPQGNTDKDKPAGASGVESAAPKDLPGSGELESTASDQADGEAAETLAS